MEYLIQNRKPERLFHFFEEISAIPRASYREEKIADYLVAFADQRGLYVYRDRCNNVLIKIPASAGMETVAPILLQGHTDMVCEKNSDVVHDFSKDPLELYVNGNELRAKGTTLGADNGIAVAMMLAVLDGELAVHPAVECLFTTAEEVGLNGALEFDYSLISARRMINLDSEELGVVTCGCAGGVRSDLTLAYSPTAFSGDAIRVRLSGLMGGHSGENINSGRANANRLMGEILASLLSDTDARLMEITGGSKDNAIPRECEALLAVPDAESAMQTITDAAKAIADTVSEEDRAFCVCTEETAAGVTMMSKEDTVRAVSVLLCPANGVLAMSHDVAGLVETSRNLGVVTTSEEQIRFAFSSRSSVESKLDASIRELDLLAAVTECKAEHYSRYPGWNFSKKSPLRDRYLAVYREVTGEEAQVNVIHAGLECGIIYSKVPMDMISIGPTMRDIHSPNEVLYLRETEVFWDTLKKLLEQSL